MFAEMGPGCIGLGPSRGLEGQAQAGAASTRESTPSRSSITAAFHRDIPHVPLASAVHVGCYLEDSVLPLITSITWISSVKYSRPGAGGRSSVSTYQPPLAPRESKVAQLGHQTELRTSWVLLTDRGDGH